MRGNERYREKREQIEKNIFEAVKQDTERQSFQQHLE